MAYPYIVLPDMEEGIELDYKDIRIGYNTSQVTDAIRALSNKFGACSICVYKLNELHKLASKPTYKVYVVNDNGEIVPK